MDIPDKIQEIRRNGANWHWLERFRIVLMLAPALTVLIVLYLGSLILALLQSFGYAPVYQINTFPTLRYYAELFNTPSFWTSMFYTFYYALVPTALGLVISIFLALTMRKRFPRKAAFQYVYKLPLMIPYLVGVSLTVLMFSNGGVLARILHALGIIDNPSQFPRILYDHSGLGVMIVYIWKQVPFMTLIIYSVLLGLGPESEEASATLGASRWQTFRHVTLPQIMPGIITGTAIVFAFNFGSFETPYILGGGFPNTLPVEAWRGFDDADYSRRLGAMAIVMIITLISGGLLFTYISWYRRFERLRGRS